MLTRRLGTSDLQLSETGFGAWAIGGSGWQFSWGSQDDKDSIEAISHAVDCGVNWIDTAPVYGLGHSETVVGKALKECSQQPFIATKCGRIWNGTGTIYGSLKRDSIRSELESSLKRLNVDTIDLYQIHWPDPEKDIKEAWETIADLIEEGKIRYAGVSNFSVSQMNRLMKIHPVTSLQPPYSMFRRDIEHELLPYCQKQNIGVIVYSPMQKGLLTGKMTKERVETFDPDDHRRNDPMFKEPQYDVNSMTVDKLSEIARRNGITQAQLAIAWILRRAEITAAIVGARKPSQIEETSSASGIVLSHDDINSIESILKERSKTLTEL